VLERRDVDAQDPGGQAPVLLCRIWRHVTRPRSRGRTGCARASKPGSPATATRIWWPSRVGGRHGQKAAQDPRGLAALPRRHSCNSCHARGVIAGELGALKVHAEFGGRRRGKGRASQSVNPDLAAQPTLCTRVASVMSYKHADMGIRQRALDSITQPSVPTGQALTPTRQPPRLPGQPVPHAPHGELRPQLAGDWRACVVPVVCRPDYQWLERRIGELEIVTASGGALSSEAATARKERRIAAAPPSTHRPDQARFREP
jgi:hypothetical protein